ncbi:hypothetical protein [Symbioplanes lichenis]|uniref:hypothetical protein n=1 Tax=Symbioplanes lichenis TaxID=1629072 RepID=UPI002739EC93|nr:hypothetical protein [Actinoplanes lichenis]
MRKSRFGRTLAALAGMVTLIAVGATPAHADTGYWYVGNGAGGCLDYSNQYGFRVFSGCTGDWRYQWLYFQHVGADPDTYRISGNNGNQGFNICLQAHGNGRQAFGAQCGSYIDLVWTVRYANNRPYFDSLAYPGLCLTRAGEDGARGWLVTTEPCAGRETQYWEWKN